MTPKIIRPWHGGTKLSIKDHALTYAKRGWYVFPSPPGGEKSGLTSAENSNGRRWGCTNDPTEIEMYWSRWPNANIGIATGLLSRIFVLEVDTPKGHGVDGFASLRTLEEHHGDLPPTLIAESPSGSRHYFFNYPEAEIKNSTSLVGKGLDVRGEGGMVIGVPSIRPGSGVYSWLNNNPVCDAPQWLLDAAHIQSAQTNQNFNDDVADLDELALAMEAIPHTDDSWATWNRIGMALWAGSGGKGFDLFDSWSQKWPGYDAKNTKARWASYTKSKPTELSAATIFYLAQENDPSWREDPVKDSLGASIVQNITASVNGHVHEANGVELPVPTPPAKEMPPELLNPPGLVGAITDWITDTALYPQRGLALGAALTVVGTAAGRHIAGPNRSGTHLYVVGLAPTGTGKNHPLTKIGELLTAAGMRQHIGPSQFISMPSVINFLVRSPLAVCAMDEFGSFLKRINSKKASGFEGAVSGMLRTAWGASFTAMATPEWAQKQSEIVYSPALSIYGVSTNREFYNSLEGADIINGVLNRFLIIETNQRPPERVPVVDPDVIPEPISEGIKRIYESSGPLSQLCQSTMMPQYRKLSISPDAEKIRKDFVKELQDKGDNNEETEGFLARTAENALRLATIVTIGREVDCIESDAMIWARDLSAWSSSRLAESAGMYISDSENQTIANEVRRIIKQKGSKNVKKSAVLQSLKYKYKTKELNDVIGQMIEGGAIKAEKLVHQGGGAPSWRYSLT